MTESNKDLIAVRKRFYHDYSFYSRWALKIRTKKNEIAPFVLNSVQQRFHAAVEAQRLRTGRVRFIILKGRQQGLSTYVSGRMFWRLSQRPAKKGLVVAHKADSTRALFDMYQRYYTLCPEQLKPSHRFSSRKELVFDKLDTALMVATAGGEGIARGETLSDAHLSEYAFWQASTAQQNLNGLLQAIPNSDDTEIFIESTANGYNDFHRICEEAIKGDSEFELFFAAWFETPEYRAPAVPDDFERTIEEEDLISTYGHLGLTDDEQLVWRRQKISAVGRDLFMQEYPCCIEEAFIASGRPVFDPEQLTELQAQAPEPIARMDVMETAAGWTLEDNMVGRLKVYHERDEGETYCIGADVGMGVRDGDWSTADVLDSQKRQVATFRAQVHPDFFATILHTLGTYYNMALVGPERNNHGFLTCVKLWKDLAYPNVYIEFKEGQTEDRETINVGHYTDVKTRPLILDKLRADMRTGDITVNDRTTLQEMKTFVVSDAGKMEAENGCHDDSVFSLAIANHIHPGRFSPIMVSDEHYSYGV